MQASPQFATSLTECIPPDAQDDRPLCQGNQPREVSGVGQVRLSHSITPEEREHAIELAELREVFYESEGQHLQAQFMRDLQIELIASRNTKGEH